MIYKNIIGVFMETKEALVIFEDLPIRKIELDGVIWISALDVAKALEYVNPAATINNTIDSNYDRFEKYLTIQKIYTGGQYRDMTFFNLKGVIAFCMLSKQPKAVPFQRWADSVLEKEILNIPKDIRIIAKRKRVEFTDTLRDHGYKKRKEYITTTVEMKGALGIDKYKKKDECDLIEVMKIQTAEQLAKTNLLISKVSGFTDAHPICLKSAKAIKNNIIQQKPSTNFVIDK